jgi:chromosome segregation ATPase
MDDQSPNDIAPAPRWPLYAAGLASLGWLVAAAARLLAALPGIALPPALPGVADAAATVLLLAAPLAVIWLVALQLRDSAANRAARAGLLAEQAAFTDRKLERSAAAMAALEDRLAQLADRIEAIATPIAERRDALATAAGALEASGTRLAAIGAGAEAAAATLGQTTPAALAQAEQLHALLETTAKALGARLAETETMLAGLHVGASEADAQAKAAAASAVASLTALGTAAGTAKAALAVPLAALQADADAAFARTAAAMDATRDGVHAQTSAMLASVDQARVTLDHIGGEAVRQIEARLQALLGNAGVLGNAITAHSERAAALIEQVGRGFTVLDAKLNNSAAAGTTSLDAITSRLAETRDAIHRLGEPITATEVLLGTVEARITSIGTAADGALAAMTGSAPQVEAMAERMNDLFERADDLARPLAAGNNSIGQARDQLDHAREALDRAAEALNEELSAARDALVEIETLTGSASIAASSQLIDVFARVRDVAGQTVGTMRETLSNVVAEAEEALREAGARQAETAFATPIRAQIAEVETLQTRAAAIGQAAAERVTQRLVALTQSVAAVEARIDETDTRYEIRTRNTLARRASKLIDSMQASAIDIAGLLAFQLEDSAWDSYLKGDRSIFVRRIVATLGSNGTRAISRHFTHDAEFRTEATHFMTEFEALIGHCLPDREGQSLATTLLSSDIGRLYTALGQAVGRFA